MDIVGNKEMARQYIDKAKLLNPSYANLYNMSQHTYLWARDFDKALEESQKLFYLDKKEAVYYWMNFKVFLLQDRMPGAVNAYAKIWNVNYPNVNTNFIEKIYTEAGKEGFLRLVASDYKKIRGIEKTHPEMDIAELYALINEKDSAIVYLEKSFGKEAACTWIKYDPFLRDLKTDPRFIALLRKMNLADD